MQLSMLPNTPICLVEGLFSVSDCNALIASINRRREAGVEFEFPDKMDDSGKDFWRDKNTYINDLDDFDRSVLEAMEDRKAIAFKKYLELIGDTEEYELQPFAAAHTWVAGADMYEHIDQYDGDSNIRHGLVMYLNEDIDGGEIYYPDYGLEIKPKTGLLVIHPGTILHGVRRVNSGVRYNMTGFALKL